MTATVYTDPAALYLRMLRRCVRTDDGCWMFTGATNSRGYSQVCSGRKSKSILGHQLAVMVRGDVVPDAHNIDHRCHNSASCEAGRHCPHRRCVNPSHLRVVPAVENTRRRWEDKRVRAPDQVPDTRWFSSLLADLHR